MIWTNSSMSCSKVNLDMNHKLHLCYIEKPRDGLDYVNRTEEKIDLSSAALMSNRTGIY